LLPSHSSRWRRPKLTWVRWNSAGQGVGEKDLHGGCHGRSGTEYSISRGSSKVQHRFPLAIGGYRTPNSGQMWFRLRFSVSLHTLPAGPVERGATLMERGQTERYVEPPNETGFCCSCGRLMALLHTIPRPQRQQQPALGRKSRRIRSGRTEHPPPHGRSARMLGDGQGRGAPGRPRPASGASTPPRAGMPPPNQR
jgi:hypothetical protein